MTDHELAGLCLPEEVAQKLTDCCRSVEKVDLDGTLLDFNSSSDLEHCLKAAEDLFGNRRIRKDSDYPSCVPREHFAKWNCFSVGGLAPLRIWEDDNLST